MATILSGLKKLVPGRINDVLAFNKAMSKLASYTHSHKYEQILKQLIERGDVKVEGEQEVKKVDPVVESPAPVVAPVPEVKVEVPTVPVAEVVETVEAPPAPVVEAPVTEPVAEKSPFKKKR